jgi:SAM-dependent methyltransferase
LRNWLLHARDGTAGARVTGIDISPAMLANAVGQESPDSLGIHYLSGDAVRLNEYIGVDRFDLVTSCLTLQDMPDIQKVLRAIHDALVVGGRLVASIAHPCTDTPFRRWAKDESGAKQWLCIDRYFDRGPMKYQWKGWAYEFSTSAHHATLEDWFAWLRDAGFVLRELREPRPSASAVRKYPELEDAARIPYFLLLDFERTG